eukprot:gene17814-19592_t
MMFWILFHYCLLAKIVVQAVDYRPLYNEESLNSHFENVEGVANSPDGRDQVKVRARKSLLSSSPDVQINGNASVSNFTTTVAPNASDIPKNNTVITDDHVYYMSTFVKNHQIITHYFKDLKSLYSQNNTNVSMTVFKNGQPDGIQFFTKYLKFSFPFYGHKVSKVLVMLSGFMHVGPVFHRFAHDVHYIAPLMANFSALNNKTFSVFTYDDGNRFTAQWEGVSEAKEKATDSKQFTFQASIFSNGSIHFAYKKIPYSLTKLAATTLKPKVGLSDGYLYTEFYYIAGHRFKIRFITRYHSVVLQKENVVSNSAYLLDPVPNCISATSCGACFSKEIAKNFKCKWCEKLNLCSDTLDWHREKWVRNDCNVKGISEKQMCLQASNSTSNERPNPNSFNSNTKGNNKKVVIIGVLVAVVVVLVIAVLAGVYCYRKGFFTNRQRFVRFNNESNTCVI